MTGFFGYGHEPLGPIGEWNFMTRLGDYEVVKEGIVPDQTNFKK